MSFNKSQIRYTIFKVPHCYIIGCIVNLHNFCKILKNYQFQKTKIISLGQF